jgi:hypothetical protein
MYDTLDTEKPENNYGLQVDVYMETINQRMSEYLVDFGLLEQEASKFGLNLLSSKTCEDLNFQFPSDTFKSLFDEMITSGMSNRFIDNASKMSDEEKNYSFMNRYFVFRKKAKVMKKTT